MGARQGSARHEAALLGIPYFLGSPILVEFVVWRNCPRFRCGPIYGLQIMVFAQMRSPAVQDIPENMVYFVQALIYTLTSRE